MARSKNTTKRKIRFESKDLRQMKSNLIEYGTKKLGYSIRDAKYMTDIAIGSLTSPEEED